MVDSNCSSHGGGTNINSWETNPTNYTVRREENVTNHRMCIYIYLPLWMLIIENVWLENIRGSTTATARGERERDWKSSIWFINKTVDEVKEKGGVYSKKKIYKWRLLWVEGRSSGFWIVGLMEWVVFVGVYFEYFRSHPQIPTQHSHVNFLGIDSFSSHYWSNEISTFDWILQ